MASGVYFPIVQELVNKIAAEDGWFSSFEQAVVDAVAAAPKDMQGIQTLGDFFTYINGLLRWVPFEEGLIVEGQEEEGLQGREIYKKLCLFYFVFSQQSVYKYQTQIEPQNANQQPLDWLSDWLVRYAQEAGKFMDTPESFTDESLETFKKCDNYHMEEYIEPHGGWKSFNQFFARNTKPGYRPVADIANSNVIVSPADSTFEDQWPVDSDSIVTIVNEINIKGIPWQISELLYQSDYKNEFSGGIFMHSFLKPNDYHRLHAPIGGKVLEARIIPGQVYLEVKADNNGRLQPIRRIAPAPIKLRVSNKGHGPGDELRDLIAPNSAGYQFCQMRGLFVLDTEIGYVAVLPIGMAQVSSVIPTAEVGKTVQKGEELAYFQFGGSDIVLVFQEKSGVQITAAKDKHYKMGEQIGTANPVSY
ncbi:putative phosphatidylserine decarboxylase [Xylaria telfairii]|nr:putative phosphatidylserine decarboxylase [Xylaria telfairii]